MNAKIVQILYINWKGETAWRQIEPIELWYGHTQWHPEDQWLLKARDIKKDAVRDFAVKDIQQWS